MTITRVGNRPATTPVNNPDAPAPTTPPAAPTATGTPAASFEGTTGTAAPIPAATAESASALALRLAATDPRLAAAIVKLRTPEGFQAAVESLGRMAAAPPDPEVDRKIFETLATLSAAGQLRPALDLLAKTAMQQGALPAMPDEKRAELVHQFEAMVNAEVAARGVGGQTEAKFESWESMSQRHLAMVRRTSVPAQGPGAPSAFKNPAFVAELEKLAHTKFTEGNTVKPLIDGPASFAERDRMIDGAKKSIHLMSWAFYDDDTGWETAKKLVEKKKQGVDVKVMVDGQVGSRPGHDKTLKLLEENGIAVVRWRDPKRVHDGQHRKIMIVDGKEAVAGGLNVGNFYSHRGPADAQKWRDTDVLIKGPAVGDSARLFAKLWNEQVATHNLSHARIGRTMTPAAEGQGRAAIINHVPGPKGDANILLATLKAIEGATTSVDIENAYFIQTPALRDALLKALERGVKVRVLTNSAESVDEPIVSAPILASLPELVEKGAEVYLKQGHTLHSKFLIVDGLYSSVGSYNLHPRSHRYEGEVTVNAIDARVAGELGQAFAKDIAAARRIGAATDIQVPKTAFSMLASRFFFDQL